MIISDCTWDGNLRRDWRTKIFSSFHLSLGGETQHLKTLGPTDNNVYVIFLMWIFSLWLWSQKTEVIFSSTKTYWPEKKQHPSPVPPLHARSRVTANGSWAQQRFWCTWKGSQQNTGFPSVLSVSLCHSWKPRAGRRAVTEPVCLTLRWQQEQQTPLSIPAAAFVHSWYKTHEWSQCCRLLE